MVETGGFLIWFIPGITVPWDPRAARFLPPLCISGTARRYSSVCITAVERIRHTEDRQGQILASAGAIFNTKVFKPP